MTGERTPEVASGDQLSPQQTAAFARHIIPSDSADLSDLKALVSGNEPGALPRVVSRTPRNYLINWRQLLLEALPQAVGAATTFPAAPLASVVLALGAVYAVVRAEDITLSEEHSAVVIALWSGAMTHEPTVARRDLEAKVAGHLHTMTLDQILRDLNRLGVILYDPAGGWVTKNDEFLAVA